MAVDNPFSVLDVPESATDDEIRAAWRRKISQVHPDVAGDHYTEEAARVNEAYSLIADSAARTRWGNRNSRTEPRPGITRCPECGQTGLTQHEVVQHLVLHAAQRDAERCDVCLRKPAEAVLYKGVTGMIVMRQHWAFGGHLCKVCGRGAFRASQSRLLLTGWWGFVSFIMTPFIAMANIARFYRHRSQLTPPEPADPSIDRTLQGRTVFARPGFILTAVVATVFVVLSATPNTTATSPRTTTAPITRPTTATSGLTSTPPTTQPRPSWTEGACVRIDTDGWVQPVRCTDRAANGRITDVVISPSLCPSGYVELGFNSYACLGDL